MSELVVTSGQIVALRLFDIAFAIDLVVAESLWTRHAGGRSARSQLSSTPPKAVAFGVPPLAITLEPVRLELPIGPVEVAVTARLFDFGAVSLAMHLPVSGRTWAEYVLQLNALARAVGPEASETLWGGPLDAVRRVLAPAMERPVASSVQEDYLLGVVHEFDAKPTAAELLQRVDLVPLLSGEQRTLSEGARSDLLRQRFSYYTDDLVVLTWDRAFIYEPRGDSDVTDVLEVANAQLLEMRYYDALLDDELPRMYDLVATTRRGMNVFAARRYAGLARRLYTALQVTEDVYLARIYAAALETFRMRTVAAGVDRKLAIIRDTYTALYDEASSSRSLLLEIVVVLLIVLEVVLAIVHP
jgi:hypothetical protein